MSNLAEKRIFVDADGNPVDELDPKAAFLAVPIGHPIPNDLAAKMTAPKRPAAKKPSKA